MSSIFALLRKDFLNFRRNKAAVSLTFIIPFAMIALFGQIFGVNRKDSGPNGIPVAVVNASASPAAAKLVTALKSEKSFRVITEFINPDKSRRPLTEADLRPLMQQPGADFRFALVLPADLISDSEFGLHLKFLSNPRNEIETQTVNGLLQKTIFANVPELIGQSLQARAKKALGEKRFDQFNGAIATAMNTAYGGDKEETQRRLAAGDFGLSDLTKPEKTPSPPAASAPAAAPGSAPATPPTPAAKSAAADLFAKLVRIDAEQVVGANVKSPMATSLVGGWGIQFLLFALSASATSLFRERDAGIFQRLLAAPVTRAQILWSKFLYGITLGLVQLVVLFFASSWLYGIEILPHLPLLVLVCIFAAAACTSFGMLLAAVSPSPEAASGLATFLIMLMSAIGGAWFPISLMPLFIQQFSKLTLVYWSMEGFSAVLWAGQSFVQLLPILGILGGITAVVMTLAVWQFNRGKIFG
ncbi:MAG: ABC transporter permease [Verrucomicrobia bacterium]|nr:ABC transporter permease [Verrucomicrobiota bacterium]